MNSHQAESKNKNGGEKERNGRLAGWQGPLNDHMTEPSAEC